MLCYDSDLLISFTRNQWFQGAVHGQVNSCQICFSCINDCQKRIWNKLHKDFDVLSKCCVVRWSDKTNGWSIFSIGWTFCYSVGYSLSHFWHWSTVLESNLVDNLNYYCFCCYEIDRKFVLEFNVLTKHQNSQKAWVKLSSIMVFHRNYNLSLLILKLSGFIFFTIKVSSNNILECHRLFFDYLAFFVSFSFSCYAYRTGSNINTTNRLKSTVLNLGTRILWNVSMLSIIITKFVNMIACQHGFKIFVDLKWFDHQVILPF